MAPIIAIEFSDVECKVVSADRGRNRLAVRTIFTVPLPRNEDAAARINERAHLLRDALKAHKIKPQRVQVVIPKNYVMARMVTLPSINDDEIAGMARFEAERHIPFNAERHVVAYHILNKMGVQGSQVLLAAVDRPIAEEYLQICQKAGMRVSKLGVSSLALFNGISLAESSVMANKVVAIVNIGSVYTDIVIATNGMVNFTRGASLGLNKLFAEVAEAGYDKPLTLDDLSKLDAVEPQKFFAPPPENSLNTDTYNGTLGGEAYEPQELQPDGEADARPISTVPRPVPINVGSLADSGAYPSISASAEKLLNEPMVAPPLPESKPAAAAAKWLLRLLQEVRRTYDFARREFNCPLIDHVYLCGEGALIQNLPQYFRINFGIECTIFDPTRSADMPKKLPEGVASRTPAFAALLGAAAPASGNAVDLNLIPEEYAERETSKRQQRSYIISGAFALIALVLGYILVSDTLKTQQAMLNQYRTRNKELKARVDELQSKETRLNIIRKYVQERHGALDVLEKISSFPFIPERVTLTRFEKRNFGSEGQEGIKLSGHARSIADVNKMEQALEDLGFFQTVDQDQGSGNWINLPHRGEKVLSYSMTAMFKKEAEKKPAATEQKPKEETETDGTE